MGYQSTGVAYFFPKDTIQLSVVQREILDLIIQGPVQPERTILLWSDGISESATAKEVGISEHDVRIIRGRWLASLARIAAAEKRLHKTFNGLVSLIFKIPNEECSSESKLDSPADDAGTRSVSRTIPTETSQLHPGTRLIIEILHHKPSIYGINRSNWTQESIAEAFGKLVDWTPSKTTVCRLLKQARLSWKKSRRVLMSPDPKYREKVELLLRTLQSLKKDEELFFIDELGPLQVRRYGGRC